MGIKRNHRILVVDDDPDLARIFKRTLERGGFDVDAFKDPAEALAQFRAGMYDLLLIDIKMPQMNGFELYKRLVEIDDKPKVCFITAFEAYSEEFMRIFPKLDVKCFLRKPIAYKDLIEQIRLQLDSTAPEKV